MKRMFSAFFAICLSAPAFAAPIPAADAVSHAGQPATVEGTVSEVFTSRRGDTFIDMGGTYPDEAFSGVIFADEARVVGDVSGLQNKIVRLTGTIRIYRGRPEIVVTSRGQIAMP
jgi:hypothetical protein